ncbi:hypothetical protein [Streptosporangium sp. H16]|uniref:hypothetical protein n=1 Tax=Streptosporangium sp. H16 TaxID=3444184 RepID=UPI003F7A2885
MHEHLDSQRVDLSPHSPGVLLTLNTLTVLAEALAPCPASGQVSDINKSVALLQSEAASFFNGTLLDRSDRVMFKGALKGFTPDQLSGDTLLHYDPQRRHFRIARDNRAHIFNWSRAVRGTGWIDLCGFAPRLVQAGHTPEQVEKLLGEVPAWRQAPEKAVTALSALWTLSRLAKAETAPREERAGRARVAAADLSRVVYRNI